MKYFIAGYAIVCMTLAVNFCYLWLSEKHLDKPYAVGSALLMACASCFFHAHHQIIFVNYLPFLVLALMGIDRIRERRRSDLFIFGLVMICFHSFYYAPCCYFVCLFYGLQTLQDLTPKKRGALFWRGLAGAVMSIGISAVLLLPTAMNILSGEKDAGSFMNDGLKVVDLTLEGLLFTPYGCGLTLTAFVCLLFAVFRGSKRFLAAGILFVMAVPAIAWMLNGFLYARGKILIPFLPLVVWICGDVISELLKCLEQRNISIRKINHLIPLLLVVPMMTSILTNQSETYVPADDQRQSRFSFEEIDAFAQDKRYRFDWLSNPFINSNLTTGCELYKTAMYSSMYNTKYGEFCYDTMGNPISLRNRVVLIPSQNPIFNYVMGIRYIQCQTEVLPAGYEILRNRDGYVLAENENVLPLAYGSKELLCAETYNRLSFPANLEALCRYTVIEHGGKEKFESTIKAVDFAEYFEGEIKPGVSKLPCRKALQNKVIFLEFDVQDSKGKGVEITINGVKNYLSDRDAPYPNGNNHFTYVFASGKKLRNLEVRASEGEWLIENIKTYFMDQDDFQKPEIDIAEKTRKNDKDTMFVGEIEMTRNGCLVTSFPYRKGYQVLIDGQEQPFNLVNTAFVGLPLDKGYHEIEICYEAPGFALGRGISCISLCLAIVFIIWERKREK